MNCDADTLDLTFGALRAIKPDLPQPQRPIAISSHAKIRMTEREISEAMLLEVIDSGDTRYKDTTHLWAFKEFPERHDDLL